MRQKKFMILSEQEAQSQSLIDRNMQEPFIWISIRDYDSPRVKLPSSKFCKGRARLAFDDVVPVPGLRFGAPMMPQQAVALVEFVQEYQDQVDQILVNCIAGISRSSGVALALSMAMNGGDPQAIANNARYAPNPRVVKEIIRAWK